MILFKSFCNKPELAANIDVTAPIQVITHRAVGLYSNIGLDLTSKYTPATTRVAACSKLETGVGPSIECGNQVFKNN